MLDLPVGVETAEAGGVVDGCGCEVAEEVGNVSGLEDLYELRDGWKG